jgi:hypothetical protein
MNENIKWGAAAAAVVGLSIGAVVYFSGRKHTEPPPAEPAIAATPPPVAAPEEPAIKHPLPAAQQQEALPALNESDDTIQGAVKGIIGEKPFEQIFIPDDLVRHIVVTIDNLPEQKVAEKIRALKPVPGKFAVQGSDVAPVLDPANYARYESLVKLLASTDTKQLIATYTRYYPLFQEAYESLGHPPEYFNDRLVVVVDHLLETPEVHDPVRLVQPSVYYQFADPQLESLSAGQKALIRMGSANAAQVKAKLREVRRGLLAQPRS